MSALDHTDTRIMRPTPGRHRLNEDLKTELISDERRAAVLRPEFPKHDFPVFVPAVTAVPDPEPVVEPKPNPLALVKDRIARNLPNATRWFRR